MTTFLVRACHDLDSTSMRDDLRILMRQVKRKEDMWLVDYLLLFVVNR